MAAAGGTRVPELVACVVGLSRGRGENFNQHRGIGKSCLCYRFIHPGFDDYVEEHQSLLALHEFENPVINNVHFLYWGSIVKRFPMKNSEKYAPVKFHVIEQTVFYQDVTSQPFTIITKPDSIDHYIKRITGPIESPGKLSYKSRDEVERYSQKQQYPSGLSRLSRGFMVVLDVSTADHEFEVQMKRAEQLLEHLMKHKRKYIIVATKRDNYDLDSLERAHELKRKYRTQLVETSANGNLNVHNAFRVLACKTLHKKPHGVTDNVPTYEDAAHHILKAKGHVKRSFQTFLTKRITDSDERLHSVVGSEEYQECKMLIGKFETDRLFAVHVLQLHNEKISLYAGVSENPDMRQEFLEEFVERRSDLVAYSPYLKNWIDSYMDELPTTSESPDGGASQPEPDVPEPYIMFEKPKGVVTSPSHETLDSGCPVDSQSQVSVVGDTDEPSKSDRDSYYSDSSNFDDHDYENYNPKEFKIPARGPSSATTTRASGSTADQSLTRESATTSVQANSVAQSLSRQMSESHGVQDHAVNTTSTVTANLVDSRVVAPPRITELAPVGTPAVHVQPLPSVNQANLVEKEIIVSPPQSSVEGEAPKQKKSSNAPPPPVRKSSSLTRPTSEHGGSVSLQGSPKLDHQTRKTSLPSTPLTVKKGDSITRSQSIKVQASRLQELLSGKSSQDAESDSSQESNTGSSSPASNKAAPPPTASKPVASSTTLQPQDLATALAAIRLKSGDVSPSLSQEIKDEERVQPSIDQIRQTLSKELAGKERENMAEESTPEPGTAEEAEVNQEYKPRLQLIKAKVAEKRRQEAQIKSLKGLADSNSAGADTSVPSQPPPSQQTTNVSSVVSSVPADNGPIIIPPLVPPKPKPAKVAAPSIPTPIKGGVVNNSKERECPPLPPPLRTDDVLGLEASAANDEEPPPLPARTPAMLEIIDKPPSPKKVVIKPNYTNVSLDSNKKEPVSLPPPPPLPHPEKKNTQKKTSNYPRTLIKKMKKVEKDKTSEPASAKKTKGKDSTSPVVSPTRKSKDSPTSKSPTKKTKPLKKANSDGNDSKSQPTAPGEVRRPVFMNMSKRPLPQIPGERKSDEEPDHTAEDYEVFDLGQGAPLSSSSYYMNYGPGGIEPIESSATLYPSKAIQRAHSFNPADMHRTQGERTNFDPLPIPPNVSRRTGTVRGSTHADYVDGYVNTNAPSKLPIRNRPLPHTPDEAKPQNKSSSFDHFDYDYPDLRKGFFGANTLPSRGRNTRSPLPNIPSSAASPWSNNGYPNVQRQNTSQSESAEDDMRDRCDSDYVPMAAAFAIDDSYINSETISGLRKHAVFSELGQQLMPQPAGQQMFPPSGGQSATQQMIPPRGGQPAAPQMIPPQSNQPAAQQRIPPQGAGQQMVPPQGVQGRVLPVPSHTVDDMATTYMNLPPGSVTQNRLPFQDELARRRDLIQQLKPGAGSPAPHQFAPSGNNLKPVELSSARHGTMAPPSPRTKPKSRQRSATTAASLDQEAAPAPSLSAALEQKWAMQSPASAHMWQPNTESPNYQNIDTTASLPVTFGQHFRGGDFDELRRASEGVIKPTTAALPPRNIPRFPQK